jgi:hypothetical protein
LEGVTDAHHVRLLTSIQYGSSLELLGRRASVLGAENVQSPGSPRGFSFLQPS